MGISVIEEPQTETYKCDYCGSTFRHHQLFEGEVIKCPSCGSHSVKIVQKVQVKVNAEGDFSYREETDVSPFGISFSVILILFVISIFIGIVINWNLIFKNLAIANFPPEAEAIFPLFVILTFLIIIFRTINRM